MLSFTGEAPAAWLAASFAAGTILLLLARGLVDRWSHLGTRPAARGVVLVFSLATALLLLLAALGPLWVSLPPAQPARLVLVLDRSNSVLRGPAGWSGMQQLADRWLAATAAVPDQASGAQVSADLITFADGVETQHYPDLAALREGVARLAPAPGAAGTDLAAALARAGEIIADAGGRGAVALLSDGFATEGDALAAARRLAAQGAPVHVLPVNGGGPTTAIAAAYAPQQVAANTDALAHIVLANGGQSMAATLTFAINPGLPATVERFGRTEPVTKSVDLAPLARAGLRQPLRFVGAGLQVVDFTLAAPGGEQRRRFFVQVTQPPKVLALGDSAWAAAVPGDVMEIIPRPVAEITANTDLTGYDAVVVNEVAAGDFAPGFLAALAQAVQEDGLGVLLLNGAHAGQEPTAPTVLNSYTGSPLEPLLPLSTRPRPTLAEPPPLHIVILIDASGSMDDPFKMSMARSIARHLITTQLRPQDRLDLLTFTTAAQHLVVDSPMTPANKAAALAQLDALQVGGGTDPNAALRLIAGRNLGECGLIFISDLEFEVVKGRPECKPTVFAVGGNPFLDSPLAEYAEPYYVDQNFSPANVRLSIYNPKPRDAFFEPGVYTPLSTEQLVAPARQLPLPSLPLEGDAISYLVEGAELNAVRPRLTDPVLAYKRSGKGEVGVFTTGLPGAWLADPAGRAAITAWVERVLPFVAQRRYNLQLTDAGDRLALRIELTGEEGPVPQVDALAAVVELAAGEVYGFELRPDAGAPGAFSASLALPRRDLAQLAYLVVQERGPDALARPQRIPLVLPAAAELRAVLAQEEFSFGANQPLLAQLAALTGGVYNQLTPLPTGGTAPPVAQPTPLWPLLLALAAICYVAAIGVQRRVS